MRNDKSVSMTSGYVHDFRAKNQNFFSLGEIEMIGLGGHAEIVSKV